MEFGSQLLPSTYSKAQAPAASCLSCDEALLEQRRQADLLNGRGRANSASVLANLQASQRTTGHCKCHIDPNFESFRNNVLRILGSTHEAITEYISGGLSLGRPAYTVLNEIRDRIDRCQREIMAVVDVLEGGEFEPNARIQAITEARNQRLRDRVTRVVADNLGCTEVDKAKEYEALVTRNEELEKALAKAKERYEAQLDKSEELLTLLLTQVSRPCEGTTVSMRRKDHRRPTSGLERDYHFPEGKYSELLEEIKADRDRLRADNTRLRRAMAVNSQQKACGPTCQHEQALDALRKDLERERAARDMELVKYANGLAETAKECLHQSKMAVSDEVLRGQLDGLQQRIQSLEASNMSLLRENATLRAEVRTNERTTQEKMETGVGASDTIRQQDASLQAMQLELDNLMEELLRLHEMYTALENREESSQACSSTTASKGSRLPTVTEAAQSLAESLGLTKRASSPARDLPTYKDAIPCFASLSRHSSGQQRELAKATDVVDAGVFFATGRKAYSAKGRGPKQASATRSKTRPK
ncbi:hypothetical protein GMRT_11062 [Giardia muris]|uniref:Uncharacterized protein n=1 Tax=Giardia muris TaxID=5742 RepID=A0A4Z1T3N6_GIAMU|nr:hypothetical protein GMRT_11062 [Giardia muris]|eukprot:TNJ27149.1 hypothetical protein GMRT_11062 [Giardia muris]